MNIKSLLIILTFSMFYTWISTATLTDFSPNIGRDLVLPEDILRAAVITFNQSYLLESSKSVLNETSIFEIVTGKYYLNRISSLSTNDLFGSLSYYNSFISLFNEINFNSQEVFNSLVNCTNIFGKFTNTSKTKFSEPKKSFEYLSTKISQLISQSDSLKASIENTITTLPINIPNAATYGAVINNFSFVSKSLNNTSNTLNGAKGSLESIRKLLDNTINTLKTYQLLGDDAYLVQMNASMKIFLIDSNSLYNNLFLFSILKDYF
ncbi:hypothetical protein ACTA71_011839 [Dictyostelium dimigraforme]